MMRRGKIGIILLIVGFVFFIAQLYDDSCITEIVIDPGTGQIIPPPFECIFWPLVEALFTIIGIPCIIIGIGLIVSAKIKTSKVL